MGLLPPPLPHLRGLFSDNEVGLTLASTSGWMVEWQHPLRTTWLLQLRAACDEYGLASTWRVDWPDYLWRMRTLDEAGVRSLLESLGLALYYDGTFELPTLADIARGLEARPEGSAVVLEYDCGHRELGQQAGASTSPQVCRVLCPCPTCQFGAYDAADVAVFAHACPRDAVIAMGVRSRVLEAHKESAARPDTDLPLADIHLRYLSSLSDIRWWVAREYTHPVHILNITLVPAIAHVATRAEAEDLLRTAGFQDMREAALRRLATLASD